MTATVARRARKLSPHSRASRLAVLDRRSVEWRRLKQVRAGLLDHLGGTVTPVQAALVERCAILTLHTELFDKKAFAGGLTERDMRAYLAFGNSLSRLLRQLGIRGGQPAAPSLTSLFDEEGSVAA